MGNNPNGGSCMARATRQLKILEIIAKYDIDTQEDLVAKLRQEGFNVTQATVSRDVKDMNIIKVLSPDGRHYKYVAQQVQDNSATDKFHNMFKGVVLNVSYGENIIVIKTESGSAAMAAALLDKLNFDGILGVIAGDDTIFVAVDTKENTPNVASKINQLLL